MSFIEDSFADSARRRNVIIWFLGQRLLTNSFSSHPPVYFCAVLLANLQINKETYQHNRNKIDKRGRKHNFPCQSRQKENQDFPWSRHASDFFPSMHRRYLKWSIPRDPFCLENSSLRKTSSRESEADHREGQTFDTQDYCRESWGAGSQSRL